MKTIWLLTNILHKYQPSASLRSRWLLHLGTPIWKPRKALLASVLRTKLTAPETKPSGRSEAARPRGVAKRRCTMHAALTVRVGAALSTLLHHSEFENSAKCRQTFSHVCSFIFKVSLMFCNCCQISINFGEKYPEFQQFVRKLSKSPRFFSNFLGFRNEYIF